MVLLCERRSVNAWLPSFLKHNNDVNNNVEETIRTVRGVLNKMTSRTFDLLLEDLKELNIWFDKETLSEIACVIFEQAIQSPLYVNLYADLCAQIRQTEKELNNGRYYFHTGLIRKVQFMFEGLLRDQNAENVPELTKMKQKRDMVGLLRFLAQIYRVKLISFHIIENCCVLFFHAFDESKNEVMIEYLMRLLLFTGPLVTNADERMKLKGFSNYCRRYKHHVCKRLRFMLYDLIKHALNDWI